jgi:DNA-binding NarL/FixJ family response regulator
MRVLVVEDDALVALDLADMLRDQGYEVVGPVASVAAALGHCRGGPVDLGLLDFNLGGETSAVLADELTSRGIKFVFVSGYRRESLPARFRETPVLSKPVSPTVLLRAIEQITN